MISNLFVLNESTFLVELNKEWISTIKEFRALIKRDKGIKGDTQARQKLKAQKEFTFIYHYCDFRSQYANYSEKERRTNALQNAELEPNLKIEDDPDLLAAVEVYLALQETPALKMLLELKEGIHVGTKVVRKIRESLENKLDEIDLDEVDASKEKDKNSRVDPIERINNRLKMIMETAKQLPDTLESIEELEQKVKKELADAPTLRGGATKGAQEDPNAHVAQIGNPFANG